MAMQLGVMGQNLSNTSGVSRVGLSNVTQAHCGLYWANIQVMETEAHAVTLPTPVCG